ncbi:cellulose binding domain-containing protein [Dactylosporangium aurantiacum]|uniref:Cellulose binding domain-containing protein n=2 Tax=Dactylosporangium aurantiacum TaxID=35754 RepID=A0A9Q9MSW4_9ACTN|nr:cellulose binding domain-containing protein [Dactylosporangium aurantiacum]MDG6107272.1 cellulose binding domain-containing protein [Dactylosporangium aurantiacum]UWZ59847.1 cellulose binding domain-containing protein [Dactylosporangium aurantiacum]
MLVAVSATTLLVGTASAVTVAAHAAAAGCSVTYTISSQWPGGFGANIEVRNLGDPLTGWTLSWSFGAGQQVTQAWNTTLAQSGSAVTARNVAWNGSLPTNGSAGFGFNGSWNGSNPAPASFALNGTTCTGGVTPPSGSASPSGSPSSSQPPGDVLSRVHTAGRVEASGNTVQYSWPGIYFEGRFRGTGVGIVLNDPNADYDIQVDGAPAGTVVLPGRTTRWVNGLSDAEHTVRLVKRNESPWGISEFGGFVAAAGGAILAKPAARTRQIEFIGDSLTAGYGNTSSGRDCPGDRVARTTNTDLSYGALTARRLFADYQINAISGRGMVRNYNGGDPGTDYRTFYDRALLSVAGDVWNPGPWRPQLVVVYLGTNDFSTAVNPGEPWTADSLVAAYRTAYAAFLQKLRTRYGADTTIVAVGSNPFGSYVQQVVQERTGAGDSRVRYWPLDETGLDRLGCDWHFSTRDDQLIADRLGTFIGTLPLSW